MPRSARHIERIIAAGLGIGIGADMNQQSI
jgi:hypothetical protein